jgi:hypothetical protein
VQDGPAIGPLGLQVTQVRGDQHWRLFQTTTYFFRTQAEMDAVTTYLDEVFTSYTVLGEIHFLYSKTNLLNFISGDVQDEWRQDPPP